MSEKLAEEVKKMFDRADVEKENLSTTELILDNSNKVSFPGYPFIFEALGKKILVSIDIFKSGYECKVCKGKKKIETKCICDSKGRPGYKHSLEELATIKDSFGESVQKARAELLCAECQGNFLSRRKIEICTECKGQGVLLHVPDMSKNIPSTGVVVSIGNRVNLEKLNYKIGDRILFGPYAGSMIPTKSGLAFKILDWNNAWCRIEGAEDLGAFDFILNEDS